MRNKKFGIIIAAIFLLGLAIYFYRDYLEDDGKVFASKAILCRHFSQSYLNTIQKTEGITDFESDKWTMAIDVETNLYDLCLLDLDKEALRNYRTTALEKYQK